MKLPRFTKVFTINTDTEYFSDQEKYKKIYILELTSMTSFRKNENVLFVTGMPCRLSSYMEKTQQVVGFRVTMMEKFNFFLFKVLLVEYFQLGMSAHENATPIRILHNSAGHLSGPARSFGAILMGYLGNSSTFSFLHLGH